VNALEKAQLSAEMPPGARTRGWTLPVLFNPARYSVTAGNTVAATPLAQGRGRPEAVRQNPRVLAMDLFLDTYEAGDDVRRHTDAVYSLLDVPDGATAPPLCDFRWGRVRFRGVLESVSGDFTLFLPDGTPVRATLGVSIQEVVTERQRPDYRLRPPATHVVIRGQTLDAIATANFGSVGRWRQIALANGVANPRKLAPGRVLDLGQP
jgi:nucleoid-associated protein YgaU